MKNNETITKILLMKNLGCIMIFESEKNEYLFIYQDINENDNIKLDTELDRNIGLKKISYN